MNETNNYIYLLKNAISDKNAENQLLKLYNSNNWYSNIDFSKITIYDTSNHYELNNFGIMYFNGSGVTQNYDLAFQYFTKSANFNNKHAINNLGHMYLHAKSVAKNYDLAFYYLAKCSNIGSKNARKNINILLNDKEFVEKNISKFIDFFKLLISKNYSIIEYDLKYIQQFLFQDYFKIINENNILKEHIKYSPDGDGYIDAKTHFEDLLKKTDAKF